MSCLEVGIITVRLKQMITMPKITSSLTRAEKQPRAKCRKWRLRLFADGKPLKSKRFSGTYSQAKAALVHFQTENELAPLISNETFEQFAARWFEHMAKYDNLAANTIANRKVGLRVLVAEFGGYKLTALTPETIEAGMQHIQVVRGYNSTSLRSRFIQLHTILQAAVERGLIIEHPMNHLKAPKAAQTHKRALTRTETKTLLETLNKQPMTEHVISVLLALLAGLRLGEVAGLEWRDVDDELLFVQRSLCCKSNTIKQPKSAAGIRCVPIVPQLQHSLNTWRRVQAMQFDFLGLTVAPTTPIITRGDGERLSSNSISRWWQANRRFYGLDVSFHELRHTCLTNLANTGANAQVLKSVAGWSNIAMANVYVHDDVDANKAAMYQMQQIL